MSKLRFLQVFRGAFRPYREARRSSRYLLVNTQIEHQLVVDRTDGIFVAKNFATKKEAKNYLRLHVAKADQEDWRLYNEVEL